MGFRRSDLQPAFSVPGDHHFTVWGYGTTDTLDEVLRPRYVQGGRSMLALGDLIYVTTRPRRGRPDERERGETRAALVMVGAWDRSGDATLRLVQDFGRPDDAGAELRGGTAVPPADASRTAAAPDKPVPPAAAKPKPAPAPAKPASPPAAPSFEPPRRKRGRPPKNRVTMGG